MTVLTIEDVQAAVRAGLRVLPCGGGSKPGLSTPADGVTRLELSTLSGVLEYTPGEFTFTALAGTPIAEVQKLLNEHGQYLPFDPPLVERGATLGGTVAAGVSGPGRYRYGGVRDFLVGIRFVDGKGDLVRGGGKVVKNAAGFDLPKLMVGSLGQLGVLVELSFKVFPKAEAHATLRRRFRSQETSDSAVDSVSPDNLTLDEATQALQRLAGAPLDIDALDLEVTGDGVTLWVRLGGLAPALFRRMERLRSLLGGGEVMQSPDEAEVWHSARELAWAPPGWSLVKVPLTPGRIISLERSLVGTRALRRYSAGGNVAWIATPEPPATLDVPLSTLGLSGLVLFGPPGQPRLGARMGEVFARRVKDALDPSRRFVEV